MATIRAILAVIICCCASCHATGPVESGARGLLAFPGAEGHGRYAVGGRGGRVIQVTNLEDDGPGSLRDAIQAKGPRTIVFDVAGYIDLKRDLDINRGYVTIAGQSAPGDGITLRGHALNIKADHVIVRYLRSRPGAAAGVETDAISIRKGHNIIVDHCSASWATDETVSIAPSRPGELRSIDLVTVQWSIISESLNDSVHSKGEHGYGSLLRGSGGARYSLHHNLWAHHRARMPRPGNYVDRERDPVGLLIDIRDNVFYNWGGRYSGYNADENSLARYSFVGNHYLPGPNSQGEIAFSESNPHARMFFSGNWMSGRLISDAQTVLELPILDVLVTKDFLHGYMMPVASENNLDDVLDQAGASRARDATDARVIESVRERSGQIIDQVADTPGWPKLSSGLALPDSDGDGMPDQWERTAGLDSGDATDGSFDPDSDGYTNLEDYLNSLVP